MDQEEIHYLNTTFTVVRKRQRRTLSVKLSPHQPPKILTNFKISQKVMLNFLISKHYWIEKNLIKIKQIQSQEHHPQFKEGELFPVLGEMKYFTFRESEIKKIKLVTEDGFISCYTPPGWLPDEKKLRTALLQFYKKEASNYLLERGKILSAELKFYPSQIKIQTAKSRWGSCNSRGVINLNWKLILFSPVLIDYVIIHELCHLKHMNHSQDFWNLVKSHCAYTTDAQAYFKFEGLRLSAFL